MSHHDLVGKTLTFEYESDAYKIEILSGSRLHWTQLRGETPGKGDEEAYLYSALGDAIGMITWIEADGLGLSNILNFAEETVTTHANMGRDVYLNPGKLIVEA